MGTGIQRYRESLDVFGAVVAGVADNRWGRPSPCDGWSAAAVVGHLVHGSRMVLAIAAGDPPVPEAEDPVAGLGGADPRTAWHASRAEAERALSRLDLDAVVSTGQLTMTVDEGLGRVSLEPLVHAWDLATATGQQLRLPDHLVEPLLAELETVAAMLRSDAMFADPVEVPAGARPQDRLLAMLGRRP